MHGSTIGSVNLDLEAERADTKPGADEIEVQRRRVCGGLPIERSPGRVVNHSRVRRREPWRALCPDPEVHDGERATGGLDRGFDAHPGRVHCERHEHVVSGLDFGAVFHDIGQRHWPQIVHHSPEPIVENESHPSAPRLHHVIFDLEPNAILLSLRNGDLLLGDRKAYFHMRQLLELLRCARL